MQVKKFEAKTMKEALQLVKQELGPEAIILNAKDNKKSYGLAGRGSIEVTAAISEKSLQKKQFTESRLPETSREKFRGTTAKQQRSLIEKTVTKYQERKQVKPSVATGRIAEATKAAANLHAALNAAPRNAGNRRYIDILDDEQTTENTSLNGRSVEEILREFAKGGTGFDETPVQQTPEPIQYALKNDFTSNGEVLSLKKEVDSLRDLLSQYQNSSLKGPLTQHPGAEYGLPFELASNFEKLQAAGVDTRYIVEILDQANRDLTGLEKKKKTLVDAWVARYLLSHTSIVGGWLEPNYHSKLHLFVGTSGHGKTSALVRVASQMIMNEKKKVAIFSADTFKVGATDQLRIYSQIFNVPFEIIKHSVEFPKLLSKYSEYDAIFVDYPGFSLKESAESEHLKNLLPTREIPKTTHLVLSCAMKDMDCYEMCQRYQMTQFNDVIVTKLDESFNHGLLYNVQRKIEKPLYAFGIGSKIPEDFELATRERVLDLIFKLTKT